MRFLVLSCCYRGVLTLGTLDDAAGSGGVDRCGGYWDAGVEK